MKKYLLATAIAFVAVPVYASSDCPGVMIPTSPRQCEELQRHLATARQAYEKHKAEQEQQAREKAARRAAEEARVAAVKEEQEREDQARRAAEQERQDREQAERDKQIEAAHAAAAAKKKRNAEINGKWHEEEAARQEEIRSRSRLVSAYMNFRYVRHCYEMRRGYAVVYVSDPEMDRAQQAIHAIIEQEKKKTPAIDLDAM